MMFEPAQGKGDIAGTTIRIVMNWYEEFGDREQ